MVSQPSLRHTKSNRAAALVALALLLACAGCLAQPAATRLYPIGETAEVAGWRVTVHSFSVLPADEWRQPQPGQTFCAVELTLENASRTIRFIMPEKQALLESAGRSYPPDVAATVLAQRERQWTVPEGEMDVGQQARGAVAYQIPARSQDVRWTFRSSLLPWSPCVTFDLGKPPQP
jgi:hypothetical protein